MENITVLDKKQEWDVLINSFDHSDFYHTYEYHQIAKKDNERPILIKYSEDGKTIAIPLLLRPVEDSPYWDATSVYGYPGPLSADIGPDFNNERFKSLFKELCIEMGIISVFSRLNPFIPFQETILKNLGQIPFCGQIVNIDLTKELEDQKKDYNRRLRSYINNARHHCNIKQAATDDEVLAYIELYYENMRRVHATKNYFFDQKYFFDLMDCPDFKAEVLLAIHTETNAIIAGAMFIKKNNIVQYHLSGSSEDHLHLNPVKMLIDEMRIIATRQGYCYFNLGGGVGSSEDSLFRFKSGFSKDFREFKLWKYIVNEPIYKELAHRKQQKVFGPSEDLYDNFFPYYRRQDPT